MIAYRFLDHGSIDSAWAVESPTGQFLGTLVPVDAEPPRYQIRPGQEDRSLGHCFDREVGAQVLGFYRKTLIGLRWLEATGATGFVHERFFQEEL